MASEVRNLAQRSASAAKEIRGLIETSVERVTTGSRLVGSAGITMREIVDAAKKVRELIDGIATSVIEHSRGVGQVGQSIAQLDPMTQQNAALVEQSAAASSSLKDQARQLELAVATFSTTGASLLAAA